MRMPTIVVRSPSKPKVIWRLKLMVQILDIILPIFTLVIAALLTIPVFRIIRKQGSHKTALTLAWFLVVFLIAGVTVANLALTYFSTANPAPLNLALDGSASTAVS